jgi:hypothetical protein
MSPTDNDPDAGDLPEWIDLDAPTPRRPKDIRGEVRATCLDCLAADDVDVARASYQFATFAEPTVWYQLVDRHGLRLVDEPAPGASERSQPEGCGLVAPDGLVVEITGTSTDADPALSYLDVRGPAGAVEAFVDDLLDAAEYVKRELRAPALVDVADAAEERGERVGDRDRLVDRGRAASVVRRLPAPDATAEGDGPHDDRLAEVAVEYLGTGEQ